MPWYTGLPLIELLETVEIVKDKDLVNARMPVQYIIRPQRDEYHDFRGYAGRIAGGIFRPGDRVTVLPSMIESEIESLLLHERHLEEAKVGD
jgi:sulfate adenylyltransferase subunit 1 (EFTu-like GTPase family)